MATQLRTKNKFQDYVSEITLTDYSFTTKKSHFLKILNILKALFDNNTASKWDLSSQDKKKGLVDYSWIVVHKIVSELENEGLIQLIGKRELTKEERKHGKKHEVNLFEITQKGLLFLLMLDKTIFEKYIEFNESKKKGDHVYQLIKYVWSAGLEKGYNTSLRKKVLISLTQGNDDIFDILLKSIIDELIEIAELTFSKLRMVKTEESIDGLFHSFIYQDSIKEYFSQLRSEDKKLSKKIAKVLLKKILMMELQLELIYGIWFNLTDTSWPKTKDIRGVKISLMVALGHFAVNLNTNAFFKPLLMKWQESSENWNRIFKEIETDEDKNPDLKRNLEKIKKQVTKEFPIAVETNNADKLLNFFSERVKVDLETPKPSSEISMKVPRHSDFEMRGVKWISKWIQNLPPKTILSGLNHQSQRGLVFRMEIPLKYELLIGRLHLDFGKKSLSRWDQLYENRKCDKKLRDFLLDNFNLKWILNNIIVEKSRSAQSVKIYDKSNFVTISINEKETKWNLLMSDGRSFEFEVYENFIDNPEDPELFLLSNEYEVENIDFESVAYRNTHEEKLISNMKPKTNNPYEKLLIEDLRSMYNSLTRAYYDNVVQ